MSVDKTLTRLNERIRNHEFYEAHQAARTIVARYVRKRDFGAAVGMLYSSALLLARAGETQSSADLLLYMIKVYQEAGVAPSNVSKGRLAEVSWQLDASDPVIKQIAARALEWAGETDRDLAHVFGTLLLRGNNLPEATKYLLRGTRASAELLAREHAAYASSAKSPQLQSELGVGAVLGFLSTGSIRNALAYLAVAPSDADWAVLMRMLCTTCRTQDAALYRQLMSHCKLNAETAQRSVESIFFGIKPAKQFNLMDMLR